MTADLYETRARARKAAHIAALVRIDGVSAAEVALATPMQKEAFAAHAGYDHASIETWAAVIGILEAIEANPVPADPFDGLT